jgi:curved DNA-binding protein
VGPGIYVLEARSQNNQKKDTVAITGDYYQVLGVDRSASQDEIQKAYRRLARRYHPDVNADADAEENFKRVNEANEVLSDPSKRARYDQFGEDWRKIPEDYAPGPFAGTGSDGGLFGGRRVYVDPADGDAGEWAGLGLDDLLGGLFGGTGTGGGTGGFGGAYGGGAGARFGGGRMSMPGADLEAAIELSVEDAYSGGRRTLSLQTPSGERSIEVSIPAGVTAGQRIRLAGQGIAGLGDGPAGDLYLVVSLAPHPRFRVERRDLTVETPIAPWEAALGASVTVETPGDSVRVQVPAGSSSGRKLRLRGRGLPNPKGAPGDLYAELKIVVPAEPSEAERELWERLAEVSEFTPDRAGEEVLR